MTALEELPGGPYGVELFFDPGCPFAWQASVWIRTVTELRDVRVGWLFISLRMVNEEKEQSVEMTEAQERALRYLRLCAAARRHLGNETVGDLYRSWGVRHWYTPAEGEFGERLVEGARAADPEEIVASLDLPEDLLESQDHTGWDPLTRKGTDEAFRRTGTRCSGPCSARFPTTSRPSPSTTRSARSPTSRASRSSSARSGPRSNPLLAS